jgi:2-phospho-L-lactate guanylyltransferase
LCVRWTVLIPVKSLPEAKSRLTGASADPAAHARLVRAIRADTIAAARAAEGVARLVLVVDGPGADASGEIAFVQTAPGLNAALAEAADEARARWPHDAVAALVGDVPALRPEDLAAALAAAAAHERAFVVDAAGTGTTLLTAAPGSAFLPRFGAGSAQRHAGVATALEAAPGLRCDVDTSTDLQLAVELGVGTATRTELRHAARAGELNASG